MSDDRELCLCFHVSRRKVQAFLRIRRPRFASALSDCGGAGTGCGWCRPYLERMFRAWQAGADGPAPDGPGDGPDADGYAAARQEYLKRRDRPT